MTETRSKFWTAASVALGPAIGLVWLLFSDDPEAAAVATLASPPEAVAVGRPSHTPLRPRAEARVVTDAPAKSIPPPADDAEQEQERQCTACQKAQCDAFHSECFQDKREAADGEASGVERAELCRSVVECVRKTGCAKDGREACYCGAGKSIDTCLASPGNGECRGVIEMAAESKDPRAVAERFIDPRWAVGSAFRLMNCSSEHCDICEQKAAAAN